MKLMGKKAGDQMTDIDAWSFEMWAFWLMLVAAVIGGLAYYSAQCEKMPCPTGTKPHFAFSSYTSSCACEPGGWRDR